VKGGKCGKTISFGRQRQQKGAGKRGFLAEGGEGHIVGTRVRFRGEKNGSKNVVVWGVNGEGELFGGERLALRVIRSSTCKGFEVRRFRGRTMTLGIKEGDKGIG